MVRQSNLTVRCFARYATTQNPITKLLVFFTSLILFSLGCIPQKSILQKKPTLKKPIQTNLTNGKDPNEKNSSGGLVTLIILPGGWKLVQIARNTTVAKFIKNQNLLGYDIVINGIGIQASEYSKIKIEGGFEIFALCQKKDGKQKCSKER